MSDVLLAANPKRGLGANDDIKITVGATMVDYFYVLLHPALYVLFSLHLGGTVLYHG